MHQHTCYARFRAQWPGLTTIIACLLGTAWGGTHSHADELRFADRTWTIKQTDTRVGPGNNLFNGSPEHVWVDDQGLHLTIKRAGELWHCSEVILNESLGYGTYVVQTNSRQDVLDANAVFGAFTWDNNPGETRFPINFRYREIDIEDSRWGGADEPTASQFVLQPWPVEGNLERYSLPDLSEDAALTRVIKWSPGKVEFTAIRGHHLPGEHPPEALLHTWTYTEDPEINHLVPEPGGETFRFNIWLCNGEPAPMRGETVEVIVSGFHYLPLD